MLNKTFFIFINVIFLILSLKVSAQESSGLMTLFTTTQERQLINTNRYKKDQAPISFVIPTIPVQDSTPDSVPKKKEIKASYIISGISINFDGSNIAWVNGKAFENGATLDDGAKVFINNSSIKSVSIKTPDGKSHTGTSGEVLKVTYMQVVED